MMAPFPPRVLGPLSECSSQIRLLGQVTSSTVTIFADGAPVATGEATAPDQWFKLNNGMQLKPGAKITAMQLFQGESSEPSPEPQIVQARPAPLGYPIYDPRQHLWVGCECLSLIGMVPGAKVTIQSLGAIYTAQADDGTAIIDRKPLSAHEVMHAHQTACGIDGPSNQSVAPESLPAGLYSASLKSLQACQTQITIEQFAEGGSVTITRQSETYSGCIPFSESLVNLDIPLQEHEEIGLQVRVPGSSSFDNPVQYTVGPQPPAPYIEGPLCAGSTTVLLKGLIRGQRVTLLEDGNPLGYFEAPADSYAVQVPALTANVHLSIEYEFCGPSQTTKRDWVVQSAPTFIPTPILQRPLVECTTRIRVSDLEPGARVQLYSKLLGAPIGEMFAVAKAHDIAVAPALIAGDQITARQTGCGHSSTSRAGEVQSLSGLALPTFLTPPTDGGRDVVVKDVLPGARVDLYVNDLFAGSAVADATSVVVPILVGHPPFLLNQKVYVQQQVCTTSNKSNYVVVQPQLPTIQSFAAVPSEITQGESSTLVWRTINDDWVNVTDDRYNLIVQRGSTDGQTTVHPTQSTTYTLFAHSRNAGSGVGRSSQPVTVTVDTVPPPPPPPPPPEQIFYFVMRNPDSVIKPCFTIAVPAPDEQTAKALAETQNGGYTATAITEQEYNNPDFCSE